MGSRGRSSTGGRSEEEDGEWTERTVTNEMGAPLTGGRFVDQIKKNCGNGPERIGGGGIDELNAQQGPAAVVGIRKAEWRKK